MNLAVQQKEKMNFIILSMGAALEAIKHEKMISHLIAFVDIDTHLSQNYLLNIAIFIQIKSSITWLIPDSLCEGHFSYT